MGQEPVLEQLALLGQAGDTDDEELAEPPVLEIGVIPLLHQAVFLPDGDRREDEGHGREGHHDPLESHRSLLSSHQFSSSDLSGTGSRGVKSRTPAASSSS